MISQDGVKNSHFSCQVIPADGKLIVPEIKNNVITASMLADGKILKTTVTGNVLTIDVPVNNPSSIASVIKVELMGK